MFLNLNGRRMQTGNTSTMIFAECIAYLSQFIARYPDDLLITGTPPGVGEGQKPTRSSSNRVTKCTSAFRSRASNASA
jgi:2-keto-4-pentenoate hydratase/2-oxohepta-3-ene-1,7-dioic acid hydratase in catechol pathway